MHVKYGSTPCSLDLPPERLAGVIHPSVPEPAASPEEIITTALDACQPAISSIRPGEKTVIITSDITRYTGSEVYLPLLVERLNRQGVSDGDIQILIALGIHRAQTPHEHEKILGALYGRIRVRDHDCDNQSGLVSIGRTFNGIDVRINRAAVEAGRLILTGVIDSTILPDSEADASLSCRASPAARPAWPATLPC